MGQHLSDTDPEIAQLQMERFRSMTEGERFQLAHELSAAAVDLAEAGIRMAHPGISEADLKIELLARLHGRELAEEYRAAMAGAG